jgi:hypothetical protein
MPAPNRMTSSHQAPVDIPLTIRELDYRIAA